MARKFYTEDGQDIPAIKYVESQPVGYTLVTDLETLKKLYMRQYSEREIDGRNYFEEFRTDLMMDIINGTHNETEVFLLEQHLHGLMVQILEGSWLTAQNTNTNLTLSGIYDQTMKDEIQAYIDLYITNNY